MSLSLVRTPLSSPLPPPHSLSSPHYRFKQPSHLPLACPPSLRLALLHAGATSPKQGLTAVAEAAACPRGAARTDTSC
eukprot:2881717-Rhodomonas_salina.1